MDVEQAIISDLADSNAWSGWLQKTQFWANEFLLTRETFVEISLIAITASIAWPFAIILRKRMHAKGEKYARYAVLKLWIALEKLAFPIVWLALQWIIVAAMAYLEYRHAALVVTSSLLTAWIVINVATVFVAHPFWSLTIAITAWIVAALNIVGLLSSTIAVLDGAAITFGQVNVSVLAIVQGLVAL